MSDQIFTKDESGLPDNAMKHPTHNGFAVMDAEDPASYHFNHTQGDGVTGTLLPLQAPQGGIRGSDNPFGKIVVGTELKKVNGQLQQVPFQPTWLGEHIKKRKGAPPMAPQQNYTEDEEQSFPDLLGDASVEEADAQVQQQKEVFRDKAAAAIKQQSEAEEQLQDLLQQMQQQESAPAAEPQSLDLSPGPAPGPPPGMQKMMQEMGAMMLQLQKMQQEGVPAAEPETEEPGNEYDPSEVPPTRVKLSGQFGTSRGAYLYVQETDEFIILVYDLDSNIFTPPASDAPFKLSCNDAEHDVYFAGVEFELPFFDCGIQVMIRS